MYYHVDPYDIIGILLETLIYGTFLVLFVLSTVLLVHRRRLLLKEDAGSAGRAKNLTFYLVMSMMMFCTISAKWLFYWPEVLPIPGGDPPQIPRLDRTAYRLKEACIQSTVLLGDSIIIYRLWILTNRSRILVSLPLIALLAFIACAISLDGPFNDTTTTPIPIEYGKIFLTRWDVAATAITLSHNLLDHPEKRVSRWIGKEISLLLQQALAVVVESAAISATWNLLFFIAGLGFNSEIALSLLNCLPAVYGVSAMLINVRVGLGFARGAGGRAGTESRSEYQTRGGIVSTMIFSVQYPSYDQEALEGQGEGSSSASSVTAIVPRGT
ncbi:hypothetical protein NP233_g262 [Leucocoprinus birnbaumii]|uniref:Uncharacterized protein n=1 Tax=Leucocoprinus birnbaumii TaxID=56174 RepID=A0AAD5W4B6_9AGAR|nr:hypothetical protein NP233_g262 [Leucocoprinus birnbaumii]